MDTKNASIALISMVQKITNKVTMLDFLQSEPVSDTIKATKYKIFFISEDNEKISNEISFFADSRETDTQKRIFRMKFQFKDKRYDKDKKYSCDLLIFLDSATKDRTGETGKNIESKNSYREGDQPHMRVIFKYNGKKYRIDMQSHVNKPNLIE